MFRRNDNRYQYRVPEKPMDSSALAAASALGRALHPDGKTVDHSKLPIYNQPSRSASARNLNRPKSTVVVTPQSSKRYSTSNNNSITTSTQRHSSLTNTTLNNGRTKTITQSRTNSVHAESKPQSRTRSITRTAQRQQQSPQIKKSTSASNLRDYHRSSSLPTKMNGSDITKKQQHDANTAFADFGDPQFVDALDTIPSHPIKIRTVKKYIPGPNGLISIEVPVNEPTVYEHHNMIPKKSSRSSLKMSQSVHTDLNTNNIKNSSSIHSKPKSKIKRSSSMHYSLKTDQDHGLHSMIELDTGATHKVRRHEHKSNDKLAAHSKRAASLTNRTKNPRHTNIIETSMPEENETTPPVVTSINEKPKSTSRYNSLGKANSKGLAKKHNVQSYQEKACTTVSKEKQQILSDTSKISKQKKQSDFSNDFSDFADNSLITNYDMVRPIVLEDDDISVIKNDFQDKTISAAEKEEVADNLLISQDESYIKDSEEIISDHEVDNAEPTTLEHVLEDKQESEAVKKNEASVSDGEDNTQSKEQINNKDLNVLENNDHTNDETVVDDINIANESNKISSTGTLTENVSEPTVTINEPLSNIQKDEKYEISQSIKDIDTAVKIGSGEIIESTSDMEVDVRDKDEKPKDDEIELGDHQTTSEKTGDITKEHIVELPDIDQNKRSSIVPETPTSLSMNDFHTPTLTTPSEVTTPPSDTSAYESTEDDINLRNSVEDIIESMDTIDVELGDNLDVSLDANKHLSRKTANNVSDNINNSESSTILKKEEKSHATYITNITENKTKEPKEVKTNKHPERKPTAEKASPKKNETKNLAHHLRSANPYLTIPPKSSKRLEDKLKNDKRKEINDKRQSILSKKEGSSHTSSNLESISRDTLEVPKPKLTKTVTPIKSALKNNPNARSNSSSVYSDYSPAEGAYLSLTTAENTRLNANIPETFTPPKRQNTSKRYTRPRSMVARVNQRSSSPTPKEKTRLNRNSTIERHSSQIRNSQMNAYSNEHITKSTLSTSQSVKAASLAINPSNKIQHPMKENDKNSKAGTTVKNRKETNGVTSNEDPTIRKVTRNNRTSKIATTSAAANNRIDPTMVGVLYPREPPQKKSSFEKLRTNDAHLGFKKMSLRDESIMKDNQQENNKGELLQDGEVEENNIVSNLLKSGGWTSRFQDSDDDDDFSEKLSGSKGSSKLSSPSKETKTRLTNGFSMFKGKQTSDNTEQNHHSNYHVHPPHSINMQRSVSTPNNPMNNDQYKSKNGSLQPVDPSCANSVQYYPNQTQQRNVNNDRRVYSSNVQNSNIGRMSERTLTKVDNGDDSNKKQGRFGKKLKKIFGRKKNDI